LIAKDNLAELYWVQGQYARAETLFKEALASRTAKLGADHPDTLTTKNNLAGLYWSRGQYTRVEPLIKEIVEARTAKLGADHPHTLTAKNNLAMLYQAQGQHAKAEPLLREALEAVRPKLGLAHPNTRTIIDNLADCYEQLQTPGKAEPLRRELVEFWKHKVGADSVEYAEHLADLARNLLLQHKAADAESILRECLTIHQKKQPDSWTTFNTHSQLGAALLAQKKYAEAEPLLKAGYQGMKKRQDKIPPQSRSRLRGATALLVQLYEATGNKDEAAKWRKQLQALQANKAGGTP
jgi:tetratricopeptide (TPR) repeat protein